VKKIDLIKNEHVERELTPHPLSFFNLHSLWIFLFAWGIFLLWLFYSPYWSSDGVAIGINIFVWLSGILIFGIIASLLLIRWRIFFIYCTFCIVGIVLIWKFNIDNVTFFLPFYTIVASLAGIPLVEAYRRSHRYFITNFRIILKGGIIRTRERSLRYEKISDIEGSQGIAGKIFGFGTIIPITHSGFGLGEDVSFAGGGGEGGKKARLFGFAGGGKVVTTARSRSYYELHGVHPYREVKALIENFLQQHTIAPYQMEQVRLQKEILDALREREDEDTV